MGLFNKAYKPEIKTNEKSKMTAFFEHIKTFTTQYLTIASVVGVIWGVFIVYDNWRDNNKVIQDNVKTIIDSQIQQTKRDSTLLLNQKEMRTELEEIKSTGNMYMQKIDALQRSYIKYISNDNSLTKTDFLQYMEGLTIDVKKNYLNSLTTQPALTPLVTNSTLK